MKTIVKLLSDEQIDREVIKDAAEIIRDGGTVVFPTETVYGLGANALDSEAVKKIFEAKGRPQDNPLIMHVADSDIDRYVESVPEVAKILMDTYWPGPLTLIFKKKDIVPNETSAGLGTIGVRMPNNEIALELIKEAEVPIAAPSANVSGRPSPTDINRCIEDLDGKVNYILGGKNSEVGVESTIVDCTEEVLCILRPGGITLEMLRDIDPNIYIDPSILKKPYEDFKPKAPGMKYRHYAPKAQVKIVNGDLQKTIEKIEEMVQNYIDMGMKVGIMSTEESKDQYSAGEVISLGSRSNLHDIGRKLFETLRVFDEKKVDIILCEGYEEKGMGVAIMNRLKKAAGFDIINV